MAFLHLIRHGQADSRGKEYDRLTPRGFEQAALLAEYYARSGVPANYIASGTLRRQKETAERFCKVYHQNNLPTPEIIEIPELNEFDPALWRNIGSEIRHKDEEFSRLFDRWRDIRHTSERKAAFVFVKLTAKILGAWANGEFMHEDVEPFDTFADRIRSFEAKLPRLPQDANALLFTSGTPISVLAGSILGMDNERIITQVRWIYNSSVTTLYRHRKSLELLSLNATPHLPNPRSRTLI